MYCARAVSSFWDAVVAMFRRVVWLCMLGFSVGFEGEIGVGGR